MAEGGRRKAERSSKLPKDTGFKPEYSLIVFAEKSLFSAQKFIYKKRHSKMLHLLLMIIKACIWLYYSSFEGTPSYQVTEIQICNCSDA